MRIGFFARTLFTSKGGIERFSSRVSSFLCQRGHECILFHEGYGAGKPVYPLHQNVRTCGLSFANIASLLEAKKLILSAELDVLCVLNSSSFRLNFLTICNNSGIPLLMSERSSPQAIEQILLNRQERLACLAAADQIHLLSPNYLPSLPDFLQSRATVISNPAPRPVPVDWSKESAQRKHILAVGRLTELDKRVSFLIQAFASLAEDFPDWDCYICGDGEYRDKYALQIRNLRLESRVKLVGTVDNLEAWYGAAHIFCIPSAYEGIPNALLEAQSHGLPSVGFAHCTGVNEIIINNENGLLAPQMKSSNLASSLRILMAAPSLRRSMGERSQVLLSRYDEEDIFHQWENMLHSTASCKGYTRLNFPQPTEEEASLLALREILSRNNPLESIDKLRQKQKQQYAAALLRANLRLPAPPTVPR